MSEVIGVKFRNVGKVYYFDPGDLDIHYQDHVIVETARGIEFGTVMLPKMDVAEDKIPQPLKPVLRKATQEDEAQDQENREKEKKAYKICKEKIAEHGLEMKLIEAEYTFDNSKVLFYFTADGRIDFRELVRDLASIFRTRIELRQVGVRDETKLLGGMGICGRPLCCHTWLTEFHPVSIKMAKDQNLSLNPSKISGVCGRLMCCLNHEADTYAYLNQGMPSRGDYVTTKDGKHGEVHSVNILRQTVKVIIDLDNDEKDLQEFSVKDITFVPKSKKPKAANGTPGKPECKCPKVKMAQSREHQLKKAIEDVRERDMEERKDRQEYRQALMKNGQNHPEKRNDRRRRPRPESQKANTPEVQEEIRQKRTQETVVVDLTEEVRVEKTSESVSETEGERNAHRRRKNRRRRPSGEQQTNRPSGNVKKKDLPKTGKPDRKETDAQKG
jgi:cell fate regulator YaaT (PSP1 superfamily)